MGRQEGEGSDADQGEEQSDPFSLDVLLKRFGID